jgi:DNA polymerase-3 subunit delta
VVAPVLDTVVYKLTDAIMRREHASAMRILDELFQMQEAPHKLVYSISLKMRQLLAARVCLENNSGRNTLIDMCGIKHEFQARALMDTARRTTLKNCRDAVLLCAQTAYELNSVPEPESRLTELIVKLAFL